MLAVVLITACDGDCDFVKRFCVAYVIVGNVFLTILKSNAQFLLPHFCCMVN